MECARVSFVLLVYVLVSVNASARIRRQRWAVDDVGCRTPDKGVGACLRITECQTMIDFLASKAEFSQKEANALNSYRCGVYGNEPKVCCPNEPINLEWVFDDEGCRTPDGGTGTCIPIDNCKIIANFIAQSSTFSDRIKDTLRRYACGFDNGENIKVCCPPKLPPEFVIPEKVTDDTRHPNYRLLPKSCGISSTLNRITNGNLTQLFEFPWAVALKYDKNVNPYSCGGSLISNRYILTAAHCIRSQSKLIGVRLGEHDFNADPDCEVIGDDDQLCATSPQDFDVSADDAVVHSEYNSNTLVNDIALIRLRRAANTSVDSVGPVCLPVTVAEKTQDFSNYTVIGWGATETGFASPILLKVQVPKVDIPTCAPLYKSRTDLTDKQLCAGGKREQDSCAGDSGGPLTSEFTANAPFRTVQYGIVSFGPRICGREGFPAVYTRVDKYMTWILDNMRP